MNEWTTIRMAPFSTPSTLATPTSTMSGAPLSCPSPPHDTLTCRWVAELRDLVVSGERPKIQVEEDDAAECPSDYKNLVEGCWVLPFFGLLTPSHFAASGS